jgi:hypothetical protein
MEVFGFILPLWAIFLVAIIVIFLAWKIIKFAIKFFIILVIIFLILMGLDALQVFDMIQDLFSIIPLF